MHGCSSNREQDYEISYAPSLKVWLLTLGYAPRAMLPMCIKERKWGPPTPSPPPTSKKEWGKKEKHTHTLHLLSLNLNEWKALVEIGRKKNKNNSHSSFTHLQWKLRVLWSGSAVPGHRCARSGRRLRKCSGGQTRTDGSLPGWPLSWTKQTASRPGRAVQPGPKQSPNRTDQPLSLQTIRIRTGTG